MEADLKSLRIDRGKKRKDAPSKWATGWILGGVTILVLLGAGRFVYGKLTSATEVEVLRVRATQPGDAGTAAGETILNATGYIIAAHKIELAAKVVGKVLWIGVEKGDHVQKDQVLVRLEDDEYRAQVQQSRGNLLNLQAKLAELVNGSRPEEVAKSRADVDQAKADMDNAKVNLDRTEQLVKEGVSAKQTLDDAKSRYAQAKARVASLDRGFELVRLGPRKEQIDAARGTIEQAKGTLAYSETQLANTIIRAPVSGTILERNVEKGEFVTTGFVGDRGAKGYVVSIADLNDLKVELDINQNDFAKLGPAQKGSITTDAFPDRKYQGQIDEISPEANRAKATVQVKVKVMNPDSFLRPEMNASVAFLSDAKPATSSTRQKPSIMVPLSAVQDGAVFVIVDGRAVRKVVKVGGTTATGVRIEQGLLGGEDLIVKPPAELKQGDRVVKKKG